MSANIRARYEASPRSANAEALRQLADVAGTDDAVNVLCLCLDIADRDGISSGRRSATEENCAERCGCRWAVPVKSARLVLAVILLFLVVVVDFTGRLMSVLADGVLGGDGAGRAPAFTA